MPLRTVESSDDLEQAVQDLEASGSTVLQVLSFAGGFMVLYRIRDGWETR